MVDSDEDDGNQAVHVHSPCEFCNELLCSNVRRTDNDFGRFGKAVNYDFQHKCSLTCSVISPRASQSISSSQPKRGPFITAMHVVLNIDFHAAMNDVFLADKKSSNFCNALHSLHG